MSSTNEILIVFDTLNKNAVDYLVIGGTAVSYYGEPRQSKTANGQIVDKPDLDIWYNPSYQNYYNLLNALEQLGRDVTRYKDEKAPNPKKSVFRYDLDDYTLDFLPNIKAPLPFRQSFLRRKVVQRNGVDIPFISLGDLILDKQALGRQKDIDDLENLKRNNPASI